MCGWVPTQPGSKLRTADASAPPVDDRCVCIGCWGASVRRRRAALHGSMSRDVPRPMWERLDRVRAFVTIFRVFGQHMLAACWSSWMGLYIHVFSAEPCW